MAALDKEGIPLRGSPRQRGRHSVLIRLVFLGQIGTAFPGAPPPEGGGYSPQRSALGSRLTLELLPVFTKSENSPPLARHASYRRYYMHGLSMGNLSVFMWSSGQDYPGPNAQSEWRVSGEKGDHWIYQKVSLRNSVTPYKIILRAMTGGRGTSDVAIDDVTLKTGNSVQGAATTATTTTTAGQTIVAGSGKVSVSKDMRKSTAFQYPSLVIIYLIMFSTVVPVSKSISSDIKINIVENPFQMMGKLRSKAEFLSSDLAP
ncbi:hypothetical protein EGW08_014615 [Elysia chlorotica]|uniref:MAM domain-containing protein n=1 Tax=Elysia chlorotica TaxID=188477 RepID=A0A3S1BCS1_ELYCH|nr:hypothetical protein EGW08_014615 [Elysia chlorotica]